LVDRAGHDADVFRVGQDDVGTEQVEGGVEDRSLVRQILDVKVIGRVDNDFQAGRTEFVEQPSRLGGLVDDVGRFLLDRQPGGVFLGDGQGLPHHRSQFRPGVGTRVRRGPRHMSSGSHAPYTGR
jgi:hypothetical protein